jgi:uncharacterized protein (TIGR01777 family)
MRILITGATGLVGVHLVSKLSERGVDIHYLTTRKGELENRAGYRGFHWNPEQGLIDENSLLGVDAIIHLAGASISKRWTRGYKQEIIESRILSANLLYKILKNNPHQVKQFISASAIGIYKNSLTKWQAEDDFEADNSFIGNVVLKWESAADRFIQLGLKVCKIRTGLVLAKEGGMLAEVVKPIRLGLGASFGSGKQWQSWIHIDDLVAMYINAVEQQWEGVYNAVAPTPVTNAEFTKEVARQLRKPLFLPNIPEFIVRLIFGEMSALLFSSQKIKAERSQKKGFVFKYLTLEEALKNLLA